MCNRLSRIFRSAVLKLGLQDALYLASVLNYPPLHSIDKSEFLGSLNQFKNMFSLPLFHVKILLTAWKYGITTLECAMNELLYKNG